MSAHIHPSSFIFHPFAAIAVAFSLGAGAIGLADDARLPAEFQKLLPLAVPLGPPRPGDWRAAHPEPAETYQQFLRSGPNRARPERRTIYVQPLGEFRPAEQKIVAITGQYMEIFFGLPVTTRKDLPLGVVPASARRMHPSWGVDQVLSTYVLSKVLAPRLPPDAAAYIAFTTSDLWPGEGWNFVFGQASLSQRVGVWSIHRFGDPETRFAPCLRRTMALASHETGHMFSLAHCLFYECNMCGSNSLAESDRRPSWLCPVCMAKLCYATGADPAVRLRRLMEFSKTRGLKAEENFYRKSLEALGR